MSSTILREGSEGADVLRLQKGLAFLGFHPGPCDGDFGPMTERAVEEFQARHRLVVDGIVGPGTSAAYNKALGESDHTLLLQRPPSKPDEALPQGDLLPWVRCASDVFPGRSGYSRTTLRSDVATAYNAMRDEVHALGGIVTSAGGRRGLAAKASPTRSRTSFHYLGRAFDLALPTGMVKPGEDPYVIERIPHSRKFVVWCATENTDVPYHKVDACVVRRLKNSKGRSYTRLDTVQLERRMFNFSAIAVKHGFSSIAGRSSFFRGGSYSGAEWWHFQYTKGLRWDETKFGEELLRVYSLERAQRFVYWNASKDLRYGKEWA
jgi:hypothetical protein